MSNAQPQDFTVEDILEDGAAHNASPDQIAGALQSWRSDLLKYGGEKHKDDPTEYWKRSAPLEKDTSAALKRMYNRAGVELLSSLPDEQRKPFVDRYNEVGGEPTKMVNDEWAIKAMEFNELNADDTYKIRKAAPVTLQAEGQDLATMALRDRGDDTWEALVMPLKEGSKPFSLQIPKPNAEQLKERGDQVQKEFDHLEEVLMEAATKESEDPSVTVSESLERSVREKSQELALVRSGDLRALALNDAGKMIKADDGKMGQIADRSLWDRFKAGTMTAAIGTGRAMRASGIDKFLEDMTGEKWGAPGADPFPGYEEALAQTSRDTARGFLPTTREKIERGAAESIGMMSATVLPAGAATRLAGGVVSELGAASAMAPMSAGMEWKAMHDMAAEARQKGDEEGAQRIESMAGWSALLQGTIDTLTEATFGETARAFQGGKQAIRNALLAGPKEAVEEIEAGVAERGVKQQAFYPEEKRQPVGEGLVVEAGAGTVAGYAMTAPQTLLGGIFSRQPQTQQEQIETQRRIATTAAPDAGTAQKVDEIHERAKDWDILNQRRTAPPVYAPPEQAPVETPVEPLEEVKEESLTPAAGEVLTPPPAVEEQPVSPPAEEPITPSPDAIQEPGTETETLRDQAGVGEGVRVEDTQGQEVAGEGAPEEKAVKPSPGYVVEEPTAKFTHNEPNDEFLYHVTTDDRLDSIFEAGEISAGQQGQFAAAAPQTNTKGRIFVTERSGVKFWTSRIAEQIEHSRDLEEGEEAEDFIKVLKIPRRLVQNPREDSDLEMTGKGRDWFTESAIPMSEQVEEAEAVKPTTINLGEQETKREISARIRETYKVTPATSGPLGAARATPAALRDTIARADAISPAAGSVARKWLAASGVLDARVDLLEAVNKVLGEIEQTAPAAPAEEPSAVPGMPQWMATSASGLTPAQEDAVEELAAQRKTAKQIAKELGVDEGGVRLVRAKRNIPPVSLSTNMGGGNIPNPEFEAWLRKRQPPAAPAEEPVPPVPVQRVEEESGFSAPLVEPQPTVEPSVEQAEVTPAPAVEEAPTATIRQQVDKESGQINYQVVVPKEMAESGQGRLGTYALRTTPTTPEGDYILSSGYYPSPQRALEQLVWQLQPERETSLGRGGSAGSRAEHEADRAQHERAAEPVRRMIAEAFRPLIKGPLNKALDAHQAKGTPAIWLDDTLITPTGKYTVRDGKLKKEQDLTQSGFERNLSSIEGATDTEGYIWAANQAAKDLMAKRAEEREEERKAEEVKAQKEREAEAAKAAEREKYAAEVRAVELPKGKKADVTIPRNDRAGNVMEPKRVPMTVHGNLAVKRNEEKHKGAPKFVVTHVPSGLRVGNPDLNTLEAAKDYMRALIHTGVDLSKKTFSTEETNKLGQAARAWNNNGTPEWWSEPAPAKAKTKAKAKGKAKARTTEESGDTRYSLARPTRRGFIRALVGTAAAAVSKAAADTVSRVKLLSPQDLKGKVKHAFRQAQAIPAFTQKVISAMAESEPVDAMHHTGSLLSSIRVALSLDRAFWTSGKPVVTNILEMQGKKPEKGETFSFTQDELVEAKDELERRLKVPNIERKLADVINRVAGMVSELTGIKLDGINIIVDESPVLSLAASRKSKTHGHSATTDLGQNIELNPITVLNLVSDNPREQASAVGTLANELAAVAQLRHHGRDAFDKDLTVLDEDEKVEVSHAADVAYNEWIAKRYSKKLQKMERESFDIAWLTQKAWDEYMGRPHTRLEEAEVDALVDLAMQTTPRSLLDAEPSDVAGDVARKGYYDAGLFSVAAPTQAKPVTQARAQQVAKRIFNGRTPSNVTFINDPNARTPEGKPWAGRANRSNGQITINLAFVQDEADLEERLKEEAVHLVYQDPAVQTAVANLEKAVTGEMLQGVAKLGYDPSVQTEEAAVRLVQQLGENPDTRGLLRKLYDAVANAFRKLFRMEPSRSQVEAAARQVMARALAGRATTGTSADVRYADAVDAEYMAAHKAKDVGTMQRIVDQVAKLAGGIATFHTGAEKFEGNVIDVPFLYAAENPEYEEAWSEAKTHKLFIFPRNPFVVEEHQGQFINMIRRAESEGREADEDEQDVTYNARAEAAMLRSQGYDVIDMPSEWQGSGTKWANGRVYIPLIPEAVKSGDAVVTDDQGNVIPPSQRFDLTSEDVRYSLSEVFGQQTAQPTKGDSYKAAETIAKAQFFDGDRPIDPQATFEATSEIYGWSGATVARLLAMGQGQTNTGEDSKAIVGKGQVELFRYAFRLAQTGDSSLLDHINVYAPKWVQLTGLGEQMTAEELATYLGSRASGLEKSATMQAAVGVGSTREEAETKNLPKEFVDDVDAEIRKTALTPTQVRKVKDDATNAQGTSIAQTVQDLADEVPEEDKTALGYIDRIDKSQVEFIPAPPKPNPVRDYIRKQEDLQTQRPKDDFIKSTIAGLEHLGVSPHVARETAERVWLVHEARRDAKVKTKDINTGVEAFISRADEEQTETRIPPKEKNIAVQTIQAAVANRDAAVEEDEFRKALTADLRKVGVTHSNAVNAAARAWQVRATQMANEARKAAAAAQARNSEVAEQILGTLAKLQSDTPSLQPAQVNPVRELIRRAMDPKQMWQKSDLTKALEDLNVEPSLAARLTDAVWTQRQNNAQATVAQVQRGLAEGTRGSLKPLEDALIAAPATKQQHPGWRQKTMVDYFTQLGLNPQQAAAAARIYDREFAARLQDALEGAIEKVASTRAPWAPHAPLPVRKRAQTDLDKLRKAVRLGVVDPNSNWHFDLARSNGWKGFTPEQFKRLAEIDDHLFDEDLSAFKKAELKQEVINMVRQAGLPPTLIDYIAASFGISGLTGLPTLFVQLAGPVNLIYKWMNDFPANPVVSTRTILASMQTFAAEVRKAYKSGVYTHAVGENLAIGSIEPLEHLVEKGIENYEKGGKDAAWGLFQMIVGMQKWVAHVFNTIDQASYAAAKIYAHTLFTAKELRQLGWTREAAGAFVLDALEGRRDTYDQLVLDGMPPDEAQITADEDFTRILNGKVPGMEDIASNEALGPIGRMGVRPEVLGERTRKGRTDQPGQRLRVIDEGAVRQIVGALIYGIDYQLAKGGAAMMGVRAVFGYIKIPFNAAVWLSNYTAYGYVRLAIDHRRRNQGKETLWKQSMAHRVQIQQRKRDAAAGLIMQGAMLGLGLLAGSSGDDDEDKSELKIYFTGRGPDDKAQRQAWMKKFKPYSITLKTGKMYTPINVGRMFETLGWQAALAGAVDDMRLNEKRGSPSFNQVADLVGSYIGSLTMRSSFQGLSMDMGGRQPSAVTEWVAHKGIFAASSFVPWKGAVMSLSRMIKDPPDQKTLTGMIEANTPFLYFRGKPSLNVFGDTIRDASFSGIAYREGIPLIPRFPTSKRDRVFYDLVLKHGRGPSIIDKGDVSKYQGVTNEMLYNYGRIRGQMMKNEIIENAAEWNSYDTIEYRRALEQMARAINPEAAEKAGLERAWE